MAAARAVAVRAVRPARARALPTGANPPANRLTATAGGGDVEEALEMFRSAQELARVGLLHDCLAVAILDLEGDTEFATAMARELYDANPDLPPYIRALLRPILGFSLRSGDDPEGNPNGFRPDGYVPGGLMPD